jgi:CheY-like chemotaxis protein
MDREFPIFVADDDENEIFIYQTAFKKLGLSNHRFVHDGEEAIQYLRGEGEYCDRVKHPFPRWLLLDLKMPKVDGLGVLRWLRDNPSCRVVPTIMMSNSAQESDIHKAYEIGINAYFTKPLHLQEMVDVLALIHHFWSIAKRPSITLDHKCI